MRQRRVFREWQHPRDDRGRFSRSGGGSWAKRAAAGFMKAEEGRAERPAVAGRPRIGRNAKAGLILNQHQPGAGDALSRKWTPPPKLPPNATLQTVGEAGTSGFTGKGAQVLHNGKWLEVSSSGSRNGVEYVRLRPRDGGDAIEITDTGQKLTVRPYQVEFLEPLEPDQAKLMAAWRADAARPPQMHFPTNREQQIERHRKEIAEAQVKLKEAQRKARARANRKYPNKEGYSKWTRDQYVDQETWREQSEAEWPERYIKGLEEPADPATEAHLNAPAWGFPVVTELNRDRPLAVYGDLMNIQNDDQATFRHLRDLSLLPAELHAIVARSMMHARHRWAKSTGPEPAAGVWLGSRPVSELNHSDDLVDDPAKLEPSADGSYKDTRKWSEVAGVYRGRNGTMIVGVSPEYSQHKGDNHQPALHEFGHALDDAVGQLLRDAGDRTVNAGDWASASPEWRELWRQTVAAGPDMNPYFSQQGEDRGAKEMWAEAFAEWARARAKARKSDLYAEGGGDFLANRGALALARDFRIPRENAAAAVALNAYFERLAAKLGVDL